MDLSKITTKIPKEVYEWGEQNAGTYFSFVSVLSYRYGEVVERAFGIRKYAKMGVLITEVRRRATGENQTIVKNLLYTRMGGYIPVFERADKFHWSYGWSYPVFYKEDFDKWYEASLPLNFYCLCLNKELLSEIDEFKYCGFSSGDVIEWLNEYRKNPMIEYFGKFNLPFSSSLISKAEKDKKFKVYLLQNASDIRTFGTQATEYAYNHSITIPEASNRLLKVKKAHKYIPVTKGRGLNEERILDFCDTNAIGYATYNDYLEAITELGLDLQDTKNLYPKDFTAMHDLRITEYESLKAKLDRTKRKELYESFAKAGEKATVYEYSDNGYSLVAPRDISDLKIEGKILDHCVGKMGYDKKMADGKIVIMFLRHTNDIQTPFVTIEFDLIQLKVLQAYGKKNTKPPIEVMAFINKWQQIMKKHIKGEQYAKIHA